MFELPKELRKKYLDRRMSELVELETALKCCDSTTIKRIGHQLAGNSANYGFSELENVGREIESLTIDQYSVSGVRLLNQYRILVENYVATIQ